MTKRTFKNLNEFQKWLSTLRRPTVVDDDIVILDECNNIDDYTVEVDCEGDKA